MEQDQTPLYATLLYEVKQTLGISWHEYIFLDMVYHLSVRTGYCYKAISKIAADLDLDRSSVNRMIVRLNKMGLLERYKQTLRVTQNYITLQSGNDAKRATKNQDPSDGMMQNAPPEQKSDAKRASSVSKRAEKQGDRITIENSNTTNVVLGADTLVRFGKQEINEMFDFWLFTVGYKIQAKVKDNRNACSNLLKRYKPEGVKKLIQLVNMAQADQFAGRAGKISDFIQLQASQSDLNAWIKTKFTARPKGRIYEV